LGIKEKDAVLRTAIPFEFAYQVKKGTNEKQDENNSKE